MTMTLGVGDIILRGCLSDCLSVFLAVWLSLRLSCSHACTETKRVPALLLEGL